MAIYTEEHSGTPPPSPLLNPWSWRTSSKMERCPGVTEAVRREPSLRPKHLADNGVPDASPEVLVVYRSTSCGSKGKLLRWMDVGFHISEHSQKPRRQLNLIWWASGLLAVNERYSSTEVKIRLDFPRSYGHSEAYV
jgi:hypothetical protein